MPETVASISGPHGGYEQVQYAGGSHHMYELDKDPNTGDLSRGKRVTGQAFVHEMLNEYGAATAPSPSIVEPNPSIDEPAASPEPEIHGSVDGHNIQISNNSQANASGNTVQIGGVAEMTPAVAPASSEPTPTVAERPGSTPDRNREITELRSRMQEQDRRIDSLLGQMAETNRLIGEVLSELIRQRQGVADASEPTPEPAPSPEPVAEPEPVSPVEPEPEPLPIVPDPDHAQSFDWGDNKSNRPGLMSRVRGNLRRTFIEPKPSHLGNMIAPEPEPVHLPMMDKLPPSQTPLRERVQSVINKISDNNVGAATPSAPSET